MNSDTIFESILRFFSIKTKEMRRKQKVADKWEGECRKTTATNYPPDKFGG